MVRDSKHKVLVMRCPQYDPQRIAAIVGEGMEELGIKPEGRVIFKPNVVLAHPEIFPHAFTRKEFLDGVIAAARDRAGNVEEMAVGERSGLGVPTRYTFKSAGYPAVIKKHKLKTYYFDEMKHVPVELKKEGRLRDRLFIPEPVTKCDFLINLPKFKAHPWCRLTLSLKNFIGLQDDRHRLVDHNSFLEHKIADLQEVVQPSFIAVDAITAGQKMMVTPTPFDMGAIVMGTNSCAVDTVCCHMVHVDPCDVVHLRFASGRGYGPSDLNDIEVGGDYPLEEIRKKTKNFQFCMERIDDYFGEESNLTCTVGTFPEKHSSGYCRGGCPGALQESMHIMRGINPNVDKEMRKIRFVVGKVEGPLNLQKDEIVIFAGDCTSWEGKIDGRDVVIKSNYRTASEVDEGKTHSNDMLLKITGNLWSCLKNRKSRYFHMRGCTVSISQVINFLSFAGKVVNPNFDSRFIVPVNVAYWQMRLMRFLNRIFK